MSTGSGCAIAIGIVVAVMSAGCGASDSPRGAPATSFEAPVHKAGESWTVKTTNTIGTPPESTTGQYTIFVDIGGERGAYIARMVPASGSSVQLTTNVDGLLVSGGDCSFSPGVNVIQFPLEIGKKWNVDYTSCRQDHTTGTAEVVGRETIATALGDLDTFKIVSEQTTTSPANTESQTPASSSNATSTTYWSIRYGVVAKSEVESKSGESTWTSSEELLSFTVAK